MLVAERTRCKAKFAALGTPVYRMLKGSTEETDQGSESQLCPPWLSDTKSSSVTLSPQAVSPGLTNEDGEEELGYGDV